MGTPDFAVPALKRLLAGPDSISAVVTQPDRPRGRGRKTVPSPVKKVAADAGITVLQPARVREPEFLDRMKTLAPDLFVVAAFGQILPQELLDVPRIMPINIHGSLLPALRGAAPVQWAILRGLRETGITIMKMDKGMDTGDILLQEAFPLTGEETGGSLFEKMAVTGGRLLIQALDLLEKGRLQAVRQPEDGITLAPPIGKEMFHIDWTMPTDEINRRIRAFDPSPGCWTEWNGQRIRLYAPFTVNMPNPPDTEPGTVLSLRNDGIVIASGDGTVGVREIQYPGKRRMSCADFLRGRKLEPGEKFS